MLLFSHQNSLPNCHPEYFLSLLFAVKPSDALLWCILVQITRVPHSNVRYLYTTHLGSLKRCEHSVDSVVDSHAKSGLTNQLVAMAANFDLQSTITFSFIRIFQPIWNLYLNPYFYLHRLSTLKTITYFICTCLYKNW